MSKILAALILFLAADVSYASEKPRVRFGEYGPLRIGMSAREASKAAGAKLVHVAPEGEEEGCFYASFATLPSSVHFMFLEGRLARIDVYERGVKKLVGR